MIAFNILFITKFTRKNTNLKFYEILDLFNLDILFPVNLKFLIKNFNEKLNSYNR